MSAAPVEHFETVWDFMMKVGPEPCAVFESLWAGDNEERWEIVMEIKNKHRDEREAEIQKVKLSREEIEAAINNMDSGTKGKRK